MARTALCPVPQRHPRCRLLQLVLVDTPGVIANQRNPLEGRMMSYVKGSMRDADAVVAIVDVSQPDRQDEVLEMVQPPPPPAEVPPMLVVLNKADKMPDEDVEVWEVRFPPVAWLACHFTAFLYVLGTFLAASLWAYRSLFSESESWLCALHSSKVWCSYRCPAQPGPLTYPNVSCMRPFMSLGSRPCRKDSCRTCAASVVAASMLSQQ